MVCSNCGAANGASAAFCVKCGHAADTVRADDLGLDRQEAYAAVIGPKNQDYYLAKFARFDLAGKAGASWHWPAFFITFYWLLYRKMWGKAVLYLLAPFLVMLPIGILGGLMGDAGEALIAIAYVLLLAAVYIGMPMYASAWYHAHCVKKIEAVGAASQDRQHQLDELARLGGTSGIALVVALLLAFVVGIGIVAAVALPAYQDYTVRAKMAHAVLELNSAASLVESHYRQHQQLPADLAQAGFSGGKQPYVQQVEVDGQTGVVSLTFAVPPLRGKSLLMVPTLSIDQTFSWECQGPDIPERLLPKQCQPTE